MDTSHRAVMRVMAETALVLMTTLLTACPPDKGGTEVSQRDAGTDAGTDAGAAIPDGGRSQSAQLIQLIEDWTAGTTVATDSSGTIHVAAAAMVQGVYKVVYAKCSGQCDTARSWTAVTFPLEANTSHVPTIALTQDGRPRIVYATSVPAQRGFHYLECDSACDGTASWRDARLTNEEPPVSIVHRPRIPFAVSPGGRAAFIEGNNFNMFARICGANCGSPGSWSVVTLAGTYVYPESVAFGGDQSLQLVARRGVMDDSILLWFDCSGTCTSTADWVQLPLAQTGGGIEAVIARTSQGGTRVVMYIDNPSTPEVHHVFTYRACDAQCRNSGSWTSPLPLAVAPNSGDLGFDLVLDSAGRPILAYLNDTTSGYASCSGNCTSPTGQWQVVTRVDVSDLNQQFPPVVPASCRTASWGMYSGPSLALQPGNKPVIAITAGSKAFGGACGTGSSHTTIRTFLSLPR